MRIPRIIRILRHHHTVNFNLFLLLTLNFSICIILLDLSLWVDLLSHEDIILKPSFLDDPIWEDHGSLSVLDALHPVSIVVGLISPDHLTVPISFILGVVSLILITRRPFEFTVSVFLIFGV